MPCISPILNCPKTEPNQLLLYLLFSYGGIKLIPPTLSLSPFISSRLNGICSSLYSFKNSSSFRFNSSFLFSCSIFPSIFLSYHTFSKTRSAMVWASSRVLLTAFCASCLKRLSRYSYHSFLLRNSFPPPTVLCTPPVHPRTRYKLGTEPFSPA